MVLATPKLRRLRGCLMFYRKQPKSILFRPRKKFNRLSLRLKVGLSRKATTEVTQPMQPDVSPCSQIRLRVILNLGINGAGVTRGSGCGLPSPASSENGKGISANKGSQVDDSPKSRVEFRKASAKGNTKSSGKWTSFSWMLLAFSQLKLPPRTAS